MGPAVESPSNFPQLPLSSLNDLYLAIIRSSLNSNEKGKEQMSFVVSVRYLTRTETTELWRCLKTYPDLAELDSKLRSEHKKYQFAKLPEKQLFMNFAPVLSDVRRLEVEKYLRAVLSAAPKNSASVCNFLSTDVAQEEPKQATEQNKEGYLIKRGKNFGGWKTRYYVLKGPVLEYFECVITGFNFLDLYLL